MKEDTTPFDRLAFSLESLLVQRFHATPSIISKQTVGLHSIGVMHIAAFICGGTANMSKELIVACLCHDQSELMTGDIPFTMKRDFPEIREVLNTAEGAYADAFLIQEPELSAEEKRILKFADQLEGMWWTLLHEPSRTVFGVWQASVGNMLKNVQDLLPRHRERVEDFITKLTHHP